MHHPDRMLNQHRPQLAFVAGIATWAFVVSTLAGAAPVNQAAAQQAQSAADDPAAGVFAETCGKCHEAARITALRRTSADWEDVIKKMIEKGAPGTEKDFRTRTPRSPGRS